MQPKYGSVAGSGSRVDPPNELRWDIDGTRGEMDPKLRLKRYNPNMELDLDPELTPPLDLR